MNILWDMRLFSTGYRDRGIGRYCRTVATALLDSHPDCSIFLWADKRHLPPELATGAVTIIPYRGGSWKSTIFTLPRIVLKHHINLVHYWVALGPLTSIGLAPVLPAPSVATIHDLGVVHWDSPHGRFLRSTPYWRMQRQFIRFVSALITNSSATYNDLRTTLAISGKPHVTLYPPLPTSDCNGPSTSSVRSPYCITLGGAPHKNLARTVDAFIKARSNRPDARLIILGTIDPSENLPTPLPEGIVHEPSMEHYEEHLRRSSGLLFCSLHEGLGLPPIEAMRFCCPLLLSDIPPHRETCDGAAVFIDPRSVDQIAEGVTSLISNPGHWETASASGMKRYIRQCGDTCALLLQLYKQLTSAS